MELFKTLFYWIVVGSKKSLSIKIIGLALFGGISFNYTDKNISFGLSTSNNEALSVLIAIIGLLMFVYQVIDESKNKAIIIQHTGIGEITTMDIDSARPFWEKGFKANTINVECDRFYKNGKVTDPEEMLKTTESIKTSIENNTRKTSPIHLKLYYGGLVQVPFAFLAGTILNNTQSVEVYDWDRIKEKWFYLKKSKVSKIKIDIQYPKIKVKNKIAIEVAISYDIDRKNTLEAVGNMPILKIQAEKISRDNLSDIKSQKYIADEFHKILDKYNKVDEINIFIAAQNSMVFNLGRQVSKRVHSKILVWQFENQNFIKNPWAVSISDTNTIFRNPKA
jgi:hypothetical protein